MKGNLNLYYDEEGDFLELNIGEHKKENQFKNLGKGVFEIVDRKTKKIAGIVIMGFKKRTQNLKEVKVSLPMKIELTAA
jgi:hypothetical protein